MSAMCLQWLVKTAAHMGVLSVEQWNEVAS